MKIIATDYKTNEVIKMLREYTGRTQEELAKDLKLTRNAIQKFEYGTNNYTFETLVKMAKKHGFKITIEKDTKK